MNINRSFAHLTWSGKAVFIAGLVLASASFWFPKHSMLHGGGGGTIGVLFVFAALFSRCNWGVALLAVSAATFCMVGGFGTNHLVDAGKMSSIVGCGIALLGFLVWFVMNLRSSKDRRIADT